MVKFGKQKETPEDRRERLRKELAAAEAEALDNLERRAPTPVQKVERKGNGDVAAALGFLDSALERFAGSFPELGPSGHAHVERVLLVAILEELRGLRADMKRGRS